MKKLLLIGTGSDVVEKKRGKFIDSYFDDVVIMNRSIFHLDTHKEYLGTPNIWASCGWYSAEQEGKLDPTKKEKENVYDVLQKSSIKEIWLNCSNQQVLGYKVPVSIVIKNIIENKHKNFAYHSLGLQAIAYASTQNYNIFYMGIDSYMKSYHYYESSIPKVTLVSMIRQSNYVREKKLIKELQQDHQIAHVDKIYRDI